MLGVGIINLPDVKTVSILDTINKTAPVLASISVDHMPIAGLLVHLPVTTVTAFLFSVDLDAISMSCHFDQALVVLFDLRHVADNQIVSNGLRFESRNLLWGFFTFWLGHVLDDLTVVD